jgi:hypothetical protein
MFKKKKKCPSLHVSTAAAYSVFYIQHEHDPDTAGGCSKCRVKMQNENA